jgi:hypothetical protein
MSVINTKFKRELLFGISAIIFIVLMTVVSVKKIHQREDLALLQIDFTDTMTKAKLCFDKDGVVQDPSQGREGKVFICSKQSIVKDVFPILKKLSRREFNYKYLSSQKCLPTGKAGFGRKCAKEGEDGNKGGRINIGRGNRLVLSCDVAEGVCRGR